MATVKWQQISVFEEVEKRKLSCTFGGNIYIDAVPRENIMEASQKFKNKTTMWSSNSTPAYFLMKTTTLIEKDI